MIRCPARPIHWSLLGRFDAARAEGLLLSLEGVRVDGRLDATDFVIHARDQLLIAGPNGAGKTTLLQSWR